LGQYQQHNQARGQPLLSVTVTINGAPFAANDTYGTTKNVTLTINAPGVLLNDNDPTDDPISPVLESGPGRWLL
jgi:hypothetical protein